MLPVQGKPLVAYQDVVIRPDNPTSLGRLEGSISSADGDGNIHAKLNLCNDEQDCSTVYPRVLSSEMNVGKLLKAFRISGRSEAWPASQAYGKGCG
jgi:hypothetical protein